MFIVLIYCLCLESGFTPLVGSSASATEPDARMEFYDYSFSKKFCDSQAVLICDLLKGFQPNSYYFTISFRFPKIDKRLDLIFLKSGLDAFCVNFRGENNFIAGKSCYYNISQYVSRPNASDLTKSLRNLRNLSITTKNDLILPVRNEIFQNFSEIYYRSPYLLGVPEECVLGLMKHLNKSSRKRLGSCCRQLREIYLNHS